MFQLIIAIFAIAISIALAGASVYYGGSAFSGATAKANVTALVNQAQQIAGAGALYSTDNAGAEATDIQNDLIADNYLQAAPTPSTVAVGAWDITEDGEYTFVQIDSDAVEAACTEVAKQNGDVDHLEDAAFTAATTIADLGAQFRCVADNADITAATDGYFLFKM